MIVRVLQSGKDAAGLTRYLFGPGKANEHTNQRMVAGSPELHAEWGGGPLTMAEATHLGRVVEAAWRRQYAPELAVAGQGAGGISRANLAGGKDAIGGQAHVHHVTIALHPDEPSLTDEQWATVAKKYVQAMGYINDPDPDPTAPINPNDVSWYAVHHGKSVPLDEHGKKDPSKPGNDHIHLVVCTTRRDGTTVDTHNSGIRSQQVRREVLEQLDFVTPLHDNDRSINAPSIKGYTAAEHNKARQRAAEGTGPAVPDRVLLQRIVRAAASQASTEAAFINDVLSHPGVRLEPLRFDPSDKGRVIGYGVAIGDGPLIPSSKLASDLTLGKLRPSWNETSESDQVARALWSGDATQLDRLAATRDVPTQLDAAAQHLRAFADALERLDPHDLSAWRDAAAGIAGTTAVLATGRPAAFSREAGRAADVLARQALGELRAEDLGDRPQAEPKVPEGVNGAELATRHIQLALRSASTDRNAGWLAVVQQISRAANAIADARAARGELQAATTLRRDGLTALDRLETALDVSSSGSSTPVSSAGERESERLLRENRSQTAAAGVASGEVGTMTEAARHAQRAAGHAQRGSGTASTPEQSAPGAPATVERGQSDEQEKGRGRR